MRPDPDPETVEMKIQQGERERAERRRADDAPEDEAAQHSRRADKAAYLRSKLEERERSEREGG